jgi:tetratricopeptide (TPR) repeat protein
LLLEALTHTHATGNVPYAAEILADLGDVSRTIGQLAESAQFLQESVRLFEQTEDREGLALALESLSDTFTELGMHPEAAAALERSDSLLPDDD